jgi:hypothetical protein
MERIFAGSIITKELINQQGSLAIQANKNKCKYKQTKLNESKLRNVKFIGPLLE